MKELKNRSLAHHPAFDYISEEDRYYLSRGEPAYRFNVIGVGVNGQEHIRVTELEGRASIHGIYDPNPRSIEAAVKQHNLIAPHRQLVCYDSLEAACMAPEVDGLIIATPNYTHLDVLKVAVQSGKHILLEKPIATNVKDAFEITRMADAYPAVLQVGLQYRYKAIYTEAIYEALTRKSIGNIKTISLLEHRVPFLDKVGQWNKFAKFTGDTLIEKCCHYFHLLNLFAEATPKDVYASGSMAINFRDFRYGGEQADMLDNALVIVNYQNGIRASFNLCMFAPMFYEELILCGDDGRIKAWENVDFLPESSSGTYLEIMHGDNKPSRRMTPHYPAAIELTGHHGATFYEHVQFIDRLEGKESDAATALDGLWSVVVAAAAQESIKTNQVVNIDAFLAANGLSI